MDVTAVAAFSSAQALSKVQAEVGVSVLRKALDLQQSSALQFLQALPQPVQVVSAATGGNIDLYV